MKKFSQLSVKDRLMSNEKAEESLKRIKEELEFYKENGKLSNERKLEPFELQYLNIQIEKLKNKK